MQELKIRVISHFLLFLSIAIVNIVASVSSAMTYHLKPYKRYSFSLSNFTCRWQPLNIVVLVLNLLCNHISAIEMNPRGATLTFQKFENKDHPSPVVKASGGPPGPSPGSCKFWKFVPCLFKLGPDSSTDSPGSKPFQLNFQKGLTTFRLLALSVKCCKFCNKMGTPKVSQQSGTTGVSHRTLFFACNVI